MHHNRVVAIACLAASVFICGCADHQSFTQPHIASIDPAPTAMPADGVRDSGDPSGAAAPTSPLPEVSTLDGCLAYAALQNQNLQAAFNNWQAAMQRIAQAKSLPDPRLTYRYYIERVETRVGAQRQSLALSQTFPWFGKLDIKENSAAQAAEAARQRYQRAKLELFQAVKVAWYEYYYLARSTEITNQNVALLKRIEAVVRQRYRTGTARHPDVIRLQIELGKLEDRVEALADMTPAAIARLNALLNRPADANIPVPARSPYVPVDIDRAAISKSMMAQNPSLREIDHEIARRDAEVKLANKAYWPDVTMSLTYIDTAHSTGGRSPDHDGRDPLIAGVSVNLPIWRDKLNAAVREANYLHKASQRRKGDLSNRLQSRLSAAIFRHQDAQRRQKLYKNILEPKAAQGVKVAADSYRTGKASFSDLLELQRVLLEFQLARERSSVDAAESLAELETLAGQSLSPPLAGDATKATGPTASKE